MSLTALKNSIISVIKNQTGAGSITPATLGALLDLFADTIQKDTAHSTSIPFTALSTNMAAHSVAGALTYLPNTSGAIPGAVTTLALIANGANIPNFSSFKKYSGSSPWVNTSGETNIVFFAFVNGAYWYSIQQEVGTSTPVPATPAAPSNLVVNDSSNTATWALSSGYAANQHEYRWRTGGSYTAWTTASTNSVNVGNIAIAIGDFEVRVKAVGIDNPSAVLTNSTAFTVSGGGGDTTPPVFQSASIQNSLPTRILLNYNENLNSGSLAASKFTVLVNGSQVNISSATVNSGSPTIVLLDLQNAVTAGQTVVVSYTPGTTGARIADTSGNFAIALTGQSVTNNVGSGSNNNLTVSGTNLTVGGSPLTVTP